MTDPHPDTHSAELLLERWQESGDPDALDQLLRIEIGALKAQLRAKRMERASMGVSDFAGEVFLRLLKQDPAPRFENPASLRGYLMRAARNLLTDRLRARRGDTVYLDATAAPALRNALAAGAVDDPVEIDEQRCALEVGLNLLNEDDRRVLQLTYLMGHSAPVVADEMGIAPEAVRMRLVRARRRLGKLLGDWQDLVS